MYRGTKACQSDRKIDLWSVNNNITEIVTYHKISNICHMLKMMNNSMVLKTKILSYKHCGQPLSELVEMFAFSLS